MRLKNWYQKERELNLNSISETISDPDQSNIIMLIGWIPGTKYPDEYVILGGHLDGFDGASGAVDNASGATVAMEAARLILAAGGKPKTDNNGSVMGCRRVWSSWALLNG